MQRELVRENMIIINTRRPKEKPLLAIPSHFEEMSKAVGFMDDTIRSSYDPEELLDFFGTMAFQRYQDHSSLHRARAGLFPQHTLSHSRLVLFQQSI